MSENQTNVCCNSRVGGSVGWNTSDDHCLYQRETRGIELWRTSTEELNSGTTVVTQLRCHGNSGELFFLCVSWLRSCQPQVTMLKP